MHDYMSCTAQFVRTRRCATLSIMVMIVDHIITWYIMFLSWLGFQCHNLPSQPYCKSSIRVRCVLFDYVSRSVHFSTESHCSDIYRTKLRCRFHGLYVHLSTGGQCVDNGNVRSGSCLWRDTRHDLN